jgi:amidohydrolase
VTILDDAAALADELSGLRRNLHRIPEIGLDLPKTQARVLEALEGLDLEITTGRALSSVVAVLRGGGGPGPVVLLRGDMDALEVHEQVDLPYRSEHDGIMHACGHDLHMAALVGAVKLLHDRRAELAGDVVFMFQPGEEGPGGAPIMLDEGLLDIAGRRVDAAYALHVTAGGDPYGTVMGRPGPIMAAVDELTIRVIGSGGHGSAPFRALDPVPVACEIVLALQTMVTRRFDVFDPVVLTVGRIAAGSRSNVIGAEATIEATVRTFSTTARDLIEVESLRVATGVAAAHGLAVEAGFTRGYPVSVNDHGEYELAEQVSRDLFGDRYYRWPNPEPGAEDFAYVMEEVPSAYLFVSACRSDPATAADNHSPLADFDDAVLPDCAALLAELAIRRLAAQPPAERDGGAAE